MKGKIAPVVLAATGVVLTVLLTAPGEAQQPTPVPFDPALSIYVAHVGTWYNCASAEEEAAEIEDPVAVFQPQEQMSDEIDVWAAHQINLPGLPAGWTFFEPAEGEAMQLKILVQDTQNRLGEAVITEWESGADVGTVTADPGGGEISGTVAVNPGVQGFKVQVKTPGGATVLQAGVNRPAVTDVIPVDVVMGWDPNRGLDHTPCPASPLEPPWGHPRNLTGKLVTGMAFTQKGCGPQDFVNDQPMTAQQLALYQELRQAELERDDAVNWQLQPHPMPPDARNQIEAKIAAARAPYQGKPQAFEAITLLPFSHGKAHWPMTVAGDVHALLYFPYRGKTVRKVQVTPELEAKALASRLAAIGKPTATTEIVASIKASLTPDERKRWQILDPEGIGDIWGLRVNAEAPPSANPNQNITAAVTFELWADFLPPAPGQPGFVGGTGEATVAAAWTNPAPPPAMPRNPQFVFPDADPNKGRVTVQLGKGWKWEATGRPNMMPYSEGTVGPWDVDGPSTRRINSNLQMLLSLNIKTVAVVNG